MKLYIAVLDDCSDHMVPTVVAHAVLAAHLKFSEIGTEYDLPLYPEYSDWLENSFKKCVVRVNQKEFDKIAAFPYCYLGYESTVLDGKFCCAVPLPYTSETELPNVLKFAKLWKPKQ